jgi:hypothetical protein
MPAASGPSTPTDDPVPPPSVSAPAIGHPSAAADEAVLRQPIRRWFWPVAIGVVLLTVLIVPFYDATNVEGISGVGGGTGPGGDLFGSLYLPYLPMVLLGLGILVWNPCWRRLGRTGMVIRARELLLLVILLFVAGPAMKMNYLRTLFINQELSKEAGKNETYQQLKATLNPCLSVPAIKDAQAADPPQPGAILLTEGITDRGETTIRGIDRLTFADLSASEQERLRRQSPSDYRPETRVGIDDLSAAEILRLRWRGLMEPITVAAGKDAGTRSPSPLAVAVRPIVVTSLLLLAALAIVLGFTAMTARQWAHHERLQYPLTQVPLALLRPSLLRDRGFQVAFGVVAAIVLFNYFRSIGANPLPAIPYGADGGAAVVNMKELWKVFGLRMPAAIRWLYETWWSSLNISPLAIGLAFLIALDVGFSLWGGFFFGAMICGWLYHAGAKVNFQHHGAAAGGGAILAMAVVVMWIGRHHYWRLLRAAFWLGRDRPSDRSGVWGLRVLLLGGATFCGWLGLLMLGFDPWDPVATTGRLLRQMTAGAVFTAAAAALLSCLMFLAYIIVIARAIAETGLATFQMPIHLSQTLFILGMPYVFPVQVLTLMNWIGATMVYDTRTCVAGYLVQATTMSESVELPKRRMLPLFYGLMAVAIVGGLFVTIIALWLVPGSAITVEPLNSLGVGSAVGMYENFRLAATDALPGLFLQMANGLNLEDGLLRDIFVYFEQIFNLRNGPKTWSLLVGAGIIFGCYGMRRIWVNFPLNPLGVVIAASWPIYTIWGSLFLGWVAKALVLRYGGSQLYARLKPAAIGLIFGEVFAAGVLVIVKACRYYYLY